jgi:hypothetical protein
MFEINGKDSLNKKSTLETVEIIIEFKLLMIINLICF